MEALPKHLQGRLKKLQEELPKLLGENLASLLIYGSVARGEFRQESSDIDLIVVLKRATTIALESIANPLKLARDADRIEAMILVEEEIPRAADVFPLLYDDLRSSHIVLYGTNPFATLEIADHHRRLRIEQELREAAIRMRRAVVDATGTPRHLVGAIERKIKQIRGTLRALLALHGKQVGVLLPEVMAAASEYYKIDLAPLGRCRENPQEALQTLQGLLDAAIEDVDRMEVPTK